MSIHKASWLGAAFGGTVSTVRLSSGHELDGRELRKNTSFTINRTITDADIGFLRGLLSHNPHLDPDEAHQKLLTCARNNAIHGRRSLSAESRVVVKQVVIELRARLTAEANANANTP